MDSFDDFRIPIRGLPEGESQFDFDWSHDFLMAYEPKEKIRGEFKCLLTAWKKPSVIQLSIHINGQIECPCDACLRWIPLTASGEFELICKTGTVPEDDPVFVQIESEQSHLRLADHFYEFSLLSLPMRRRIECEDMPEPPCDFDILEKMQDDAPIEQKENPFSELKNLFEKEE